MYVSGGGGPVCPRVTNGFHISTHVIGVNVATGDTCIGKGRGKDDDRPRCGVGRTGITVSMYGEVMLSQSLRRASGATIGAAAEESICQPHILASLYRV